MSTWTDEQLAAFTGGELDASSTMAIREEMARDPALAARVARQRQLDDLLGSLTPPEPDPDFSARLREETTAVVREVTGDELSARRSRREVPAWTRWAMGGAAAAVALVVGIGVVSGIGGGDDTADTAMEARDVGSESMADESMDAMDDMAMDDEAMDDSAMAESALAPDPSPLIVDQGEEFDDQTLEILANGVRARAGFIDPGTARELSQSNSSAFGAPAPAPADDSDDGGLADSTEETEDGPTATSGGGTVSAEVAAGSGVSDEDLADVNRCLVPLLEADQGELPVIPLEARLGTRDGVPVVTYLFLAQDAATGEYSRVEVWVTDRTTCEIVTFTNL